MVFVKSQKVTVVIELSCFLIREKFSRYTGCMLLSDPEQHMFNHVLDPFSNISINRMSRRDSHEVNEHQKRIILKTPTQMQQTAVLTALLGVFAGNAKAQGVQCSGSRTHWGLSQFQQNKVDVNCWLDWSGWSECSGHCGQAVITATRLCRGNIPGLGGCQGSELKRKRCSDSKIVQGRETNSHVLI